MFARTTIHLLLAAALFLVGCDDASPTDPLSSSTQEFGLLERFSPKAERMVPIHWAYYMRVASFEMLPCEAPPGVTMAIPRYWSASGRMTHLGRLNPAQSRAQFNSCVMNFVDGNPVSLVGEAEVWLVGANGDEVALKGTLTRSFLDGSCLGEWDIMGGTGRFEGASGWMKTSERPVDNGTGSVGRGSGKITPPGILKRRNRRWNH